MQHHPGNIHQSVATPRYSATPFFSTIRLLAFARSIHTLSWHATCFLNSGIVINPSLSDGPQK